MKQYNRKRPAHHAPIETGNRTVIVFVTVCTKQRRLLLANEETHQMLRKIWAPADKWLVGRYVIMPDHVHLFCAPSAWPPENLRSWVSYWKNAVSREWRRQGGEGVLWQRDFWDTQLRSGERYSAKWDYVRQNPVRAGPVKDADDWCFQGEVNRLRWHDR